MRISNFEDIKNLVVRLGYKIDVFSLGSGLKSGYGRHEGVVYFTEKNNTFSVHHTLGWTGRTMAIDNLLSVLEKKGKIRIISRGNKDNDWIVEVIE